jgi:hypothetical protein
MLANPSLTGACAGLVLLVATTCFAQDVPPACGEAQPNEWQEYEACSPRLTPAQQREWESLSQDQRRGFLDQHCTDQPSPPPAPAATSLQPSSQVRRVALGSLQNKAGIREEEIVYLTGIVSQVMGTVSSHEYQVAPLEPTTAPCDATCQLQAAIDAGFEFLVAGEVQTFGGAYTVTLQLYNTVSRQVIETAQTDGFHELGQLIKPTRAAAEKLKQIFARKAPPARAAPVFEPAPSYTGSYYVTPAVSGDDLGGARRERRGPDGLKIAAHITVWPGLLLAIVGGVLVGTANAPENEDSPGRADYLVGGISSIIIGSGLILGGGICGLVHLTRERDRQKGRGLTLGPLVTPRIAGVALRFSF